MEDVYMPRTSTSAPAYFALILMLIVLSTGFAGCDPCLGKSSDQCAETAKEACRLARTIDPANLPKDCMLQPPQKPGRDECDSSCPTYTSNDSNGYYLSLYCTPVAGTDVKGIPVCDRNCAQVASCKSAVACTDDSAFRYRTTCLCTASGGTPPTNPQALVTACTAGGAGGYTPPPAPSGCRSCSLGYYDEMVCECRKDSGEWAYSTIQKKSQCQSVITNCNGNLTCGACPCGNLDQPCCNGKCTSGSCLGGKCSPPCGEVGQACCHGSGVGQRNGCTTPANCDGGLCREPPGPVHAFSARFANIDDEAYVWLYSVPAFGATNPENAACWIKNGNVPRTGSCDITAKMKAQGPYHTKEKVVIKIGNPVCLNTQGDIYLYMDGKEIWHGRKGNMITHCGYTYRVEVNVDLVAGSASVANVNQCILPTDCMD